MWAAVSMGITTFGFIVAIAALAVGYLLGIGTTHYHQTGMTEGRYYSINFKQAKNAFILTLALAFATYLMLVSILATQIFDPKVVDLAAPRARLDQSLSRIVGKDAP